MKDYSYYKFENRKVVKLEQKDINSKQILNNVDWMNIYLDNRAEISEALSFLNLTNEVINIINEPDNYLLTKVFDDLIIQNFVFSKKTDIIDKDYLTIIITNQITICIFPKGESFDIEKEGSSHIKNQFSKDRIYYAYLLIQKALTQSTINVGIARKQLFKLEQLMISSPDKISSSQVMNIFTRIWQLSEMIEEQYIGFKFFYNIMLNKQKEPDSNKLKEIIDSFSELSRITDRQEERIESLKMHFMMIHQEESSHKINVLTIIQAIFVPLTFLAGVYGMNFNNMPELDWKYAYFVVWGIFISLSIVLLFFFKKNGWFD